MTSSSFDSFGLHPDLRKAIARLGFATPSPIQVQAIPPAMRGRDVLACAMTGSGKTAAFLLPIMHRLLLDRQAAADQPGTPATRPNRATRVLVLTPTRELAAQVRAHAADFAWFTDITSAAVFGGVGMQPQEAAFRSGVDIIVACPGRLLDHFTYPYGKLPHLDFLVLDEADRMLDMGFLPDIRRVLRHLPTTPRQTLFFSATMPEPIVHLSREMLKNPVAIDIDRESKPADGITQTAWPVPEARKTALLLEILQRENVRNAIVFTRTKHRADRLAKALVEQGVSCAALHGNRSQNQRTQALAGFKDGSIRILVATDIAARGIDVEALSHVINFDVPHISDDYIHRVGRTARANRVGQAYTFVTPDDEADFRQIERRSEKKIIRRRLEGFDYSASVGGEALEIPLAQRIAAIRARKAEERARAAAKAAARAAREAAGRTGGGQPRGAGSNHTHRSPAIAPRSTRTGSHHGTPQDSPRTPGREGFGSDFRTGTGSSFRAGSGSRSGGGGGGGAGASSGPRPLGRTGHSPRPTSDQERSHGATRPTGQGPGRGAPHPTIVSVQAQGGERPSTPARDDDRTPMRPPSRQVGQPCAPLGQIQGASHSRRHPDQGSRHRSDQRSSDRQGNRDQASRRSSQNQGRPRSVPMFD